MNKYLFFPITLLFICMEVNAEAPFIEPVIDQDANQGEQYTFQPVERPGGMAYWTKTFGPDDVSVNPVIGTVSWDIPSGMPSESFHIGVKASNNDGEYEETWIVTVGGGSVFYVGPDEALTTLKQGMAAMSSGDTLVMRNGEWDHSNQDNTIPGNEKKGQALPSGSASAFTTLMAEDPSKVIMDANNEETLISLWGATKHPDFELDNNGWATPTDYIAIKGLVLLNSRSEAIRINNSKYIKLINLGIGPSANGTGALANVYIYRSQYVLIEGMYVWGHGRYKIQFKNSSESIVRRSVARIDNYNGGEPIGGYISYCSKNILFQNNILVDSDHPEYWGDHQEIINAFGVPATNCEAYPEFNEFKRNLALNAHMGLMNTDARQNDNATLWEDLVGWDLKPARHNGGTGGVVPILSGVGATTTNKMTLGEVNTEGNYLVYSRDKFSDINNSIFYRIGWNGTAVVDNGDLIREGSSGDISLDFNNIFGFLGDFSDGSGSPVVNNTIEVDPEFRYITMLPRDSSLQLAGKDGARIGAQLMLMLGRSGSFYGESGYDAETTIPMWPLPIEAAAHSHFKQFTFAGTDRNGGTAGIQGERGFAVEGETLSNYVWSYLGETVPPFKVTALAGHNQVRLYWLASADMEQSTLKEYNVYLLKADGDKVLQKTVPKDVYFVDVKALNNGSSYEFIVTAVRNDGNESDYGYSVSVTPEIKPRPLAPILSIE
jgi:hypothetical protein